MFNSEGNAESVGRGVGGGRFSTAVVLFHAAVADRLGVNVTDWKCAEILTRIGPTNPGKLSEMTGMTTAATAQVINRLERAGIVQRERDPNDRRKVIILMVSNSKIAEASKAILKQFTKEMGEMMAKYNTAEIETIRNFVESATEILEAQSARLRKGNSDSEGF